jgi:hypothetical protein
MERTIFLSTLLHHSVSFSVFLLSVSNCGGCSSAAMRDCKVNSELHSVPFQVL